MNDKQFDKNLFLQSLKVSPNANLNGYGVVPLPPPNPPIRREKPPTINDTVNDIIQEGVQRTERVIDSAERHFELGNHEHAFKLLGTITGGVNKLQHNASSSLSDYTSIPVGADESRIRNAENNWIDNSSLLNRAHKLAKQIHTVKQSEPQL